MSRYSARQKKLRGQGKQSHFILLPWGVKRSRAYHGLSAPARAAFVEIIDRYDGRNNGRIGLGVRELAYELNCSQAKAWRALGELEDSGLIIPTKLGAWRGKKATEWRIVFHVCDETGELPIKQWEQRQPFREFHPRNLKVSPVKNRDGLSITHETHRAKNSMNDPGLSFTHETHVPIYHTHRANAGDAGQLRSELKAWRKPTCIEARNA
jgi:hypothetical protein